jgi:hypothetical protein
MGAWGYGIRHDDFVCDVIDEFENALKHGKNIREATQAVRHQFGEVLSDPDLAALYWIGLADAQWTYGNLDPAVRKRVKRDLASGLSLAMWDDAKSGRARRQKALERFVRKIERPNNRPKKAPKVIVRPPKFQPGDCLTCRLSNGQYGAALVLGTDHSQPEYGKDLIAILDYMAAEKPSIGTFEGRKWLRQRHHQWQGEMALAYYLSFGFGSVKDRIELVGRIQLSSSDPQPTPLGTLTGWKGFGEEVVRQREWDDERR